MERPGSLKFSQYKTHQVVERIGRVSAIGQNNPNFGHQFSVIGVYNSQGLQ